MYKELCTQWVCGGIRVHASPPPIHTLGHKSRRRGELSSHSSCRKAFSPLAPPLAPPSAHGSCLMLSHLSLAVRGVCGSAKSLRDLVHWEVFGGGGVLAGRIWEGVDCGRITPWGFVGYFEHTASLAGYTSCANVPNIAR